MHDKGYSNSAATRKSAAAPQVAVAGHWSSNRVDPWGPEWRHDWVTWRAMLPKYLDEFA